MNKNIINKINNAREVLSPLNKIITEELTVKNISKKFFLVGS